MESFSFLKLFIVISFLVDSVAGYTVSTLNRRVIAGVWKLRGIPNFLSNNRYPMKEFTTYPTETSNIEDFLLMLKEDGSFTQYDNQEQNNMQNKEKDNNSAMKGTWDYRDGELMLAADRPDGRKSHDTMFVGTVVAKSQESLHDNPVLRKEDETEHKTSSPPSIDTHLSVPKGDVKIGKFMYPRKHQMFFEQPMFQPMKMGSFELKQILGTLNAALVGEEEPDLTEKFRKTDFAEKKFFLTNYPIPERKPQGDLRWSIKYNKFVRDPLPYKKKEKEEESEKKTESIRVMEVLLFANNTFATTAGLGDSTVLRGKWGIHGDQRDRFWMQVWRFGFGRSVSGSTFSEGPNLSHHDDKMYWGWINYMDEDEEKGENSSPQDSVGGKGTDSKRRLQVKGNVIIGYLEPQPVAQFIMREEVEAEEDLDDEEYDGEDDDEELKFKMPENDDGIDWSNAFQ